MRRTTLELSLLLREGCHLSIDANDYTVVDIRTLISALSASTGSLEVRNCGKFHTSELLILVRYGKNHLKLVF